VRASRVERHEGDVEHDPPDPHEVLLGEREPEQTAHGEVEVLRREEDDDRGRCDVLDRLGRARDEAAPGAHGRAGERVGAARVRHGRRHLADREGQAVVHDHEHDEGDEHAAEAREVDAEVPAREVARDDRGDGEAPEAPHSRRAAQSALLEVALVDAGVRDTARRLGRFRHAFLLGGWTSSPGWTGGGARSMAGRLVALEGKHAAKGGLCPPLTASTPRERARRC